MKYISLDIETTCLNPKTPENILMLSMVVEDTENILPLEELPQLTTFFRQDHYTGEAYALQMNAWILEILSGKTTKDGRFGIVNGINSDRYMKEVNEFFLDNFGSEKATLAGKNIVSFDYQFLPDWLKGMFKSRMIDPGCMFMDFKEGIPDLSSIKTKLGMGSIVTHNAYEDALDVIRVLRTKYDTNRHI